MEKYLIRRLLLLIPVVIGVISLVFFIIHLIPGDPIEVMLGETAKVADKEILRAELGLDKPVVQQYFEYITNVLKGDLGHSIHSKKSVVFLILEKIPATVELALASLFIALLIAIPAGMISAKKQYSVFDNVSMFGALLGISIPNFWLGPMLIILFSISLGWLPVSGRGGFLHIILPAITLGTALSGILARILRSSLLEEIKKDYIVTARSKGLSSLAVLFKHAALNSLIPLVTVLGLQLGALLSGSIITETIFAWPGIGRLTINAITKRDYPLVQGCVLLIALSYVLINFMLDVLYTYLDPRIKYK